MKNIKVCFLLPILFCVGCSSALKMQLPGQRLHMPETVGYKEFEIGVGFGLSKEAIVTNSVKGNPIQIQDPAPIESTGQGHARASLGAFNDQFEFWLKNEGYLLSGIWMFGMKYQFLGNSLKKSRVSDFSLAGLIGTGAGSKRDTSFIPYTKSDQWISEYQASMIDFALVSGYRVRDNMLIFAGPFYTKFNYKYTAHRPVDGFNSIPSETIHGDGSGHIWGANIGTRFDLAEQRTSSFSIELNINRADISNINQQTYITMAGVFTALTH